MKGYKASMSRFRGLQAKLQKSPPRKAPWQWMSLFFQDISGTKSRQYASIRFFAWILLLGISFLWAISSPGHNPSMPQAALMGFLLCLPITFCRYGMVLPLLLPGITRIPDKTGRKSQAVGNLLFCFVPSPHSGMPSWFCTKPQPAFSENRQRLYEPRKELLPSRATVIPELMSSIVILGAATIMVFKLTDQLAAVALYGTICVLQVGDFLVLFHGVRSAPPQLEGFGDLRNKLRSTAAVGKLEPVVPRHVSPPIQTLSPQGRIPQTMSRGHFCPRKSSRQKKSDSDHCKDLKITQRVVRGLLANGEERLEAELWAEVGSGVHHKVLHLAFCPPFGEVPRVEVEQMEGPPSRLRIAQILPHGTRIEIKLPEVSSKDARVKLRVYAVGKSLGSDMPSGIFQPTAAQVCSEPSV